MRKQRLVIREKRENHWDVFFLTKVKSFAEYDSQIFEKNTAVLQNCIDALSAINVRRGRNFLNNV